MTLTRNTSVSTMETEVGNSLSRTKRIESSTSTTATPANDVTTPGSTARRDENEWDDIDFNLVDLNIDLSFDWERSLATKAWYLVMGGTAILDFISAMLVSAEEYVSNKEDSTSLPSSSSSSSLSTTTLLKRRDMDKNKSFHLDHHYGHVHDDEEDEFTETLFRKWLLTALTPFLQWLNKHAEMLGLLFSLLWFIDSFVAANISRIRATRRIDQKPHLARTAQDGQGQEEESSKASSTRYMVHWFNTPQAVYIKRVLVQLLLLPVGFYIYIYSAIKSHRLQHVEEQEIRIVHNQHPQEKSLFGLMLYKNHWLEVSVETFTMNSNLSLIIALLQHVFMEVSTRLKLHFTNQSVLQGRKAVKQLFWKAIRDPRNFNRKLRTGLYYFRWIKYLFPLIGTINKFLGSAKDLLKLYNQKRRARRAHKLRARLRYEMSSDERRQHAALLIQKQYRAHISCQHMLALQKLQGDKEHFAALRLQRQFKAALQRARARLARKHVALKQLQKRAKELRKNKKAKVMDADDWLQMNQLQNELEKKTKEMLNEKLLMRPNTTFAVAWRTVFVVTVMFEVLIKVFAPLIKDQNVEGFLQYYLVPIPVSLLPQCLPPEEPGAHWPKALRPLSKLLLLLRRALPLFLGGTRALIPSPFPWYCNNIYYAFCQTVVIITLEFLIHHFLVIIGIICFLDVFITFFTGQFDEKTGRLVPKPFFQRWILPGMVLQLLVNPQMGTTSKWVWQAWLGVFRLGPVRCLRWTIALLFPLLMSTKRWIKRQWHRLVVNQNEKIKYSFYTNELERRVCTAFHVSLPPDTTRRMSTKCIDFCGSIVVHQ